MSWLLGRNRPQQPQEMAAPGGDGDDRQPSQTAGEKAGDAQLSKAERKAMEAYRFDSSALERAAEAARTLERSSKLKILSAKISSAYYSKGVGGVIKRHQVISLSISYIA